MYSGRSKPRRGADSSAPADAPEPPATSTDPVRQAKDVCLRLLTSRPRTRAELEQALRKREVADPVIEQVLDRLDKAGLIDDAEFAQTWVRSRHNYQGLARRALAVELRRKGVDESATSAALSTLDGAAEEQRARELVRRKLHTSLGKDETTRIRRLVGMLARKGYPEGLAFRIVREELRAEGTDTAQLDDLADAEGSE